MQHSPPIIRPVGCATCVPGTCNNLAVKVRYGGTYQPTISEAQAIRREARSGESV